MQNAGNNIPLSKQVHYFNAPRSKMAAVAGSGAVSAHLSKSFFLIASAATTCPCSPTRRSRRATGQPRRSRATPPPSTAASSPTTRPPSRYIKKEKNSTE